MRYLLWKLRISLLWIAVAALAMMHMILELAAPGAIDELRAGSLHGMDTAGPVTIMWVLFVLVPLAMAFLTFVLPDTPARWSNGVLGVISAVLWTPLPGSDEAMTPGALVVTVSVIVAGLLVAWFAWKVPTQDPIETNRESALHG
jgi:membrane protease YdiL (CAAX protease family)